MWLITAMSASRIPACFAALGVLSAQWQSDTLRASLGVWSSSLATKLCLVHLYSRCAKHDRKICRSAFWVSHHKTLHERKMKCVWLFKSNVTGDKTHDKTWVLELRSFKTRTFTTSKPHDLHVKAWFTHETYFERLWICIHQTLPDALCEFKLWFGFG